MANYVVSIGSVGLNPRLGLCFLHKPHFTVNVFIILDRIMKISLYSVQHERSRDHFSSWPVDFFIVSNFSRNSSLEISPFANLLVKFMIGSALTLD